MPLNTRIMFAAFVALTLVSTAPPKEALAQTAPGSPYAPRVLRLRPRIEITPRAPLYRRCIERLELQYRPSGPVLYPLTYCWWVRG